MNYNFIFLAVVFVITGFVGLWYFSAIPDKDTLKKRLSRSIPLSLGIIAIIGVVVWYIFSQYNGFSRVFRLAPVLYGLMLFEASFLLLIRWIKSNYIAASISLLFSILVLSLHERVDSFLTFNAIIITSFIGATAFLVRLRIIRSWLVMTPAVVFVYYDWYFVNNVYTQFTKPSVDPHPVFLFPAVTIGDISLGGGDFLFLLLFSFILFLRFGMQSAYVHIGLQGLGLLVAAYFVARTEAIVPFMLVMIPIFFIVWLFFRFQKNRLSIKDNY